MMATATVAERLSVTSELAGGLLVVLATFALLLTIRAYGSWWRWEGRPAWEKVRAWLDALPRYRLRLERRQ